MKTPQAAHHVRVTPFGVSIEPVEVLSVDTLRGVALCRVDRPGFVLKNEIPFAELASSARKTVAMVAALLVPSPAAESTWATRRRAAREAAALHALTNPAPAEKSAISMAGAGAVA